MSRTYSTSDLYALVSSTSARVDALVGCVGEMAKTLDALVGSVTKLELSSIPSASPRSLAMDVGPADCSGVDRRAVGNKAEHVAASGLETPEARVARERAEAKAAKEARILRNLSLLGTCACGAPAVLRIAGKGHCAACEAKHDAATKAQREKAAKAATKAAKAK